MNPISIKSLLAFIAVSSIAMLLSTAIAVYAKDYAKDSQTNTAPDYTKLSAPEMVDMFSKQLVDNIDKWDELRNKDKQAFYQDLHKWGLPWFNHKRIAAAVMGKKYYLQATRQQRLEFSDVLFNSLIANYAQGLFLVEVTKVEVVKDTAGSSPKFHNVIQRVASGDSDTDITYQMYRKNANDYWRVVNVVANGINFKKTLEGSFQRLAQRHGGNVEKVITNWDSTNDSIADK